MNDPEKLRTLLLERLARVIDPETGSDALNVLLDELADDVQAADS